MTDRRHAYELAVRRARGNWWKYRPRPVIGPPDPVLLATMIEDLGHELPQGRPWEVLFDPEKVTDQQFYVLMRVAAEELGITFPEEAPTMTMKNHPRRNDAIAILTSVIVTEELNDMSETYPPDGVEYQQMVDQVTDAVRARVTTWYDLIAGVLDTPDEPGAGARRYLESMYPDGVYPHYEDEGPYPGRGDRKETEA